MTPTAGTGTGGDSYGDGHGNGRGDGDGYGDGGYGGGFGHNNNDPIVYLTSGLDLRSLAEWVLTTDSHN